MSSERNRSGVGNGEKCLFSVPCRPFDQKVLEMKTEGRHFLGNGFVLLLIYYSEERFEPGWILAGEVPWLRWHRQFEDVQVFSLCCELFQVQLWFFPKSESVPAWQGKPWGWWWHPQKCRGLKYIPLCSCATSPESHPTCSNTPKFSESLHEKNGRGSKITERHIFSTLPWQELFSSQNVHLPIFLQRQHQKQCQWCSSSGVLHILSIAISDFPMFDLPCWPEYKWHSAFF